jgi:hypothetical protein
MGRDYDAQQRAYLQTRCPRCDAEPGAACTLIGPAARAKAEEVGAPVTRGAHAERRDRYRLRASLTVLAGG